MASMDNALGRWGGGQTATWISTSCAPLSHPLPMADDQSRYSFWGRVRGSKGSGTYNTVGDGRLLPLPTDTESQLFHA